MLRKASANSSRGPLALLLGLASLAFVLSAFRGASVRAAADAAPNAPPSAPVRSVTDESFGTKVVDPYRYMENLKDPEVQAWMKAQNDYTRAVLAGIPGRQQLLARIRELGQSAPAQVSD